MTAEPLRIVICSAGRRVELLSCFRAAAARLGARLDVIACDLDPGQSAACALADRAVAVPRCDDPGYAAAVLELVRKTGARLVVPTIDPDLMPLAQAAAEFAALGARLHVSPAEVIGVVRDKQRTCEVLAAAGVPVPGTLDHAGFLAQPQALGWPVFAKPSGGSASRELRVFERPQDLPDSFPEPMIFQQLLTGPEYTINMFIDQAGSLRTVIPHLRQQVRAGEVEKGVTERRRDLREIAEGIAGALPALRGVCCFQVLDDPRRGPRVIEINARFGGGYPLADRAGARFAEWLLEEVLGRPCSAADDWRAGVRMLRYDSAVYLE